MKLLKKFDTSKLAKVTDPLFKAIDKIGKLSKLYRILISIGVILVLTGPLVYFSYLPKMKQIDELNKEYSELDNKLTSLKTKVRQLAALQKKVKAAEGEFKIVMRALPEKKDIPTLLSSISRSGQDAGLEFLLFQPSKENHKDFYAEIPVSIQVTGDYHNVAVFFDKVARLSRIVNIDNINLTAAKAAGEGKGQTLQTSCTAVTYRFIEPEDDKDKGNKGKKKKKKK